MSKSLKWAIPAITACLVVLSVAAWYFVSPKEDAPLAEVVEETPVKIKKVVASPAVVPKKVVAPTLAKKPEPVQNKVSIDPAPAPARKPASLAPMNRLEKNSKKKRFVHEADFPTHVETHDNDRAPSNDEDYREKDMDREPMDQDREPVEPREDIVDAEDSQSLDKEMNREPANHDPAIDPPVTEEPTDY